MFFYLLLLDEICYYPIKTISNESLIKGEMIPFVFMMI